jgi:hypothetical protein
MNRDRYARLAHWYRWVTWFGIFLNMLFVIPLLFFPTPFLALPGASRPLRRRPCGQPRQLERSEGI